MFEEVDFIRLRLQYNHYDFATVYYSSVYYKLFFDHQSSPSLCSERQVEMFNRSIRQMEEGSRVLTERMNTYQRLLGGRKWSILSQPPGRSSATQPNQSSHFSGETELAEAGSGLLRPRPLVQGRWCGTWWELLIDAFLSFLRQATFINKLHHDELFSCSLDADGGRAADDRPPLPRDWGRLWGECDVSRAMFINN